MVINDYDDDEEDDDDDDDDEEEEKERMVELPKPHWILVGS